jgi:protoheme IX farnesyltransferase
VVLNALFLWGAYKIWRRPEEAAKADMYRSEKSFFGLSLMYLFLHFGAILAEAALKPYGLGGW